MRTANHRVARDLPGVKEMRFELELVMLQSDLLLYLFAYLTFQ